MISRRGWLASTGIAAASQTVAQTIAPKNIVIASGNGKVACARAMQMLRANNDTLEAVVAGVTMVENDPEDDSVGYGGLPNEEGIVELDASVMHGPTRRCGSVASVRNIKNVARLAKMVMEETDHVMLVGEGAARFARALGIKEEDLLTEKSRIAWLVWKRSLRDRRGHNNWTDGLDSPGPAAALRGMFPNVDEATLAYAWDRAINPVTGTINCLALNAKGEMSGTTTTSGLSWKIPGRVGDSPIIGAGLYVDQEVGAAGSTGRGEENIRVAGAHTIVENMRHGMSPKDAVMDCLKRVSRNYNHDKDRLAKFDINFYALSKNGQYAGASLWNQKKRNGEWSRNFTINDGGESRLEPCIFLYQRTA